MLTQESHCAHGNNFDIYGAWFYALSSKTIDPRRVFATLAFSSQFYATRIGSDGLTFCDNISSISSAAVLGLWFSAAGVGGEEEDKGFRDLHHTTTATIQEFWHKRWYCGSDKGEHLFIIFGFGLLLFTASRCCCSLTVRTLTKAPNHYILSPRRCPLYFTASTFGCMNTTKLKKPWRVKNTRAITLRVRPE